MPRAWLAQRREPALRLVGAPSDPLNGTPGPTRTARPAAGRRRRPPGARREAREPIHWPTAELASRSTDRRACGRHRRRAPSRPGRGHRPADLLGDPVPIGLVHPGRRRGAPDEEPPSWGHLADEGWRAAEQLAQPAVGAETMAGLPRRVPQANLVPGSAQPPPRSVAHRAGRRRASPRTPPATSGAGSAGRRSADSRSASGTGPPGNSTGNNGRAKAATRGPASDDHRDHVHEQPQLTAGRHAGPYAGRRPRRAGHGGRCRGSRSRPGCRPSGPNS